MRNARNGVLVVAITFASVLASALIAEKQQAQQDLLMQEMRGAIYAAR